MTFCFESVQLISQRGFKNESILEYLNAAPKGSKCARSLYIIIKWPLKSVQRDGAYGLTLYLVSLHRSCRCSRRGWIRGHHRQYRRWRRRRGWSRRSGRRRRGHWGQRPEAGNGCANPAPTQYRLQQHQISRFDPLARKEQTMAKKGTKYQANLCPICYISLETFEGPKLLFYWNVCLFDLGSEVLISCMLCAIIYTRNQDLRSWL